MCNSFVLGSYSNHYISRILLFATLAVIIFLLGSLVHYYAHERSLIFHFFTKNFPSGERIVSLSDSIYLNENIKAFPLLLACFPLYSKTLFSASYYNPSHHVIQISACTITKKENVSIDVDIRR